jgi:hypothetical protein
MLADLADTPCPEDFKAKPDKISIRLRHFI